MLQVHATSNLHLRFYFWYIHEAKLPREFMAYWNFRFHLSFSPGLAHLSNFTILAKQIGIVFMQHVRAAHLPHSRNCSLRNLVRLLLERILKRLRAIYFRCIRIVLLHVSFLTVYCLGVALCIHLWTYLGVTVLCRQKGRGQRRLRPAIAFLFSRFRQLGRVWRVWLMMVVQRAVTCVDMMRHAWARGTRLIWSSIILLLFMRGWRYLILSLHLP